MMPEQKFMWASSNDSIMNHCMANIERLRRFFSSYSKFVVIGSINTLQLQELLATNLLFSSKPVAWMTGGVYSRLLTRDKEDVLESFVHDQGSPNHLVVILSDSQNCREVERAVQFCAENFYPCLIISRLPPPTTEQAQRRSAGKHKSRERTGPRIHAGRAGRERPCQQGDKAG